MKLISKFVQWLVNKGMQFLNKINSQEITMSPAFFEPRGRYLSYHILNNKLLENYEVLQLIFNRLKNDEAFKKMSHKKILFMECVIDGGKYAFHRNVLITDTTTFEEYWNKIEGDIQNHYDNSVYWVDRIPTFELKVWDLNSPLNRNIKGKPGNTGDSDINNPGFQRSNYSIDGFQSPHNSVGVKGLQISTSKKSVYYEKVSPFRNFNKKSLQLTKYLGLPIFNTYDVFPSKILARLAHIKPLKPKKFYDLDHQQPFSTMDIETISIKSLDNTQVPVIITAHSNLHQNLMFKIDNIALKQAIETENWLKIDELVNNLWGEYFQYLMKNSFPSTIFVHNLGSFDGMFLYKALLKSFDKDYVKSIIDPKNSFISITYNDGVKSFTWKDSYRIFPISLVDLCKVFGVDGKLGNYNPMFNDISLYDNLDLLSVFLNYSIQDSKCLYEALLSAQDIYYNEYQVDITTIFSTSTLSLKIFRQSYLKTDIPIMSKSEDSFVRKSYFGGSTDVYKGYGENLYYYDVNSLYPYAMLKPMPLNLIRTHKKLPENELENFFGFIECLIECPDNIKLPFLPYKHLGKTIFPIGKWKGTYFSEEIKMAIKHGYKVQFFKAYEYSKDNLFEEYIKHFYEIKKNNFGTYRFIAKMHLNQLYGYFGRKIELLETINISLDELDYYVRTRIIKSMIQINDNTLTLLIYNNLDGEILSNVNENLPIKIKTNYAFVKSNVGIASAVTAYARMHMTPYKLENDVYYSDTDSIFTSNKLPSNQVGSELGQMKDELDGKIIKKAYFIGIKQYGYYYIDSKDNVVEQSVFSGVDRNSLTFEEVESIYNGKVILKATGDRFFRSIQRLDVKIKSVNTTISKSYVKVLVDNKYLPLKLNLPYTPNSKLKLFLSKILTSMKKLLKLLTPPNPTKHVVK